MFSFFKSSDRAAQIKIELEQIGSTQKSPTESRGYFHFDMASFLGNSKRKAEEKVADQVDSLIKLRKELRGKINELSNSIYNRKSRQPSDADKKSAEQLTAYLNDYVLLQTTFSQVAQSYVKDLNDQPLPLTSKNKKICF
jgi:hypothetical protein